MRQTSRLPAAGAGLWLPGAMHDDGTEVADARDARRVPRHVRADPVRRGRRRADRAEQRRGRQPGDDQHRVGPGRGDGLLRVGRRVGRAPESGRHDCAGGASPLPVAQGVAVLAGADRWARSSARRSCSSRTTRRSPPSTAASGRCWATHGTAGIFATYPKAFLSTFPGGFIDQVVGHGHPHGRDLRDHRRAPLACPPGLARCSSACWSSASG